MAWWLASSSDGWGRIWFVFGFGFFGFSEDELWVFWRWITGFMFLFLQMFGFVFGWQGRSIARFVFVFLLMFRFVFVVFVFGWQGRSVVRFVFVFVFIFLLEISLCLCLVDKKGQENAWKSEHVILCLNLDLCSLEFLLKMNSDLIHVFFGF